MLTLAMLLEILWNNETTPADLRDGTVTVGGGGTDDISIDGLPHGLLTLTIEGARAQVTSIRSVRIGAALFPARVPRLLIEGEELKLPNDVVLRRVSDPARRESRKVVETAFVAKELLASGEVAIDQTRAASLTCVTGHDEGLVFPIAFAECIIGRADDADIRVRDRAASRRHAALIREGHSYQLKELSTTNGVFVNGLRVRGTRAVKSGDVIELGQTMLRFEAHARGPGEGTNTEQPAPPPAVEPVKMPPPDPVLTSAQTDKLEPHRRRFPAELALMSLGALLVVAGIAATVFLLS